jgi:uncharacterized radical SAM superfamily protein
MAASERAVTFYYPGKSFPSVSVTGRGCALSCDYCGGRFLQGMWPVRTPEELRAFADGLIKKGGKGFLLSGGCDAQGRIPLLPFVREVRHIKQATKLVVNVHSGLLDVDAARALVPSGADCYSVDLVRDEWVIGEVMHLPSGKQAYRDTLDALVDARAPRVVPHVCVGIGSEGAEAEAIALASRYPVAALVLLVFMPTRGTPMANAPVPSAERVLSAVRAAVHEARCPVLIGCMRPRGNWELETRCIEEGAAGIASPSRHTVAWAKEHGYSVERRDTCCALHL